jgi:hypothetical protein
VAITSGDLEPHAVQGNRAVALTLRSGDLEEAGCLVIRSPRESGGNDWKTTLRPDYGPFQKNCNTL